MTLNSFKKVRRAFSALPVNSQKTDLGDRAFVAGLVTASASDSASGSLEGLRRSVVAKTDCIISRQSFHERLATAKLGNQLAQILNSQADECSRIKSTRHPLAIALGINEIYLQDASTLQLPKEARFIFKGVNTDKDNGGAKLHLTYNLLASQVACFEVSSGVDNDSNYFVSVERYRGNLIIADLGYYCFERFKEIDTAEGFFLSRLKTNVKALVVATSTPEEGNNVGRLLSKTK